MPYTYETHLHTSGASDCGNSKGSEYIGRYIDLGYDGIMITNHFFGGNTGIDRRLPWKEWVKRFCQSYEEALDTGYKRNFKVFFGWEQNFQGDEYLVYGLDKAWLLDHPESIKWTRLEQYEQVRAAGGCVVQVHPFRDRGYIPVMHLSTGCVDAIEGINMGNQPHNDALAMRYGERLGLPITAGSDIHSLYQWPDDQMAGIITKEPLNSVKDYVDLLVNKKPFERRALKGRGEWQEGIEITLPVDIRDRQDRSTGLDIYEFLGLQ